MHCGRFGSSFVDQDGRDKLVRGRKVMSGEDVLDSSRTGDVQMRHWQASNGRHLHLINVSFVNAKRPVKTCAGSMSSGAVSELLFIGAWNSGRVDSSCS